MVSSCKQGWRSAQKIIPLKPNVEVLEDRTVLSTFKGGPDLETLVNGDYDPSSILMRFRPGVESTVRGNDILPGTELQEGIALIPEWHEVLLSPGISVRDALTAYQADPRVMYAEPNYHIYATDTIPNDPQWNNAGLWGLRKIQAP